MDGHPTRVRFRTILLESAALGALAVLALWLPWARAAQPTDAKAEVLAKQAENQAIALRSASIEDDLKGCRVIPGPARTTKAMGSAPTSACTFRPFPSLWPRGMGCLGRYGQNEGQIRTEPDVIDDVISLKRRKAN